MSALHFMDLMAGNPAAVGTEEGGVLRAPLGATPNWWNTQLLAHLKGTPCGVYPLVHGSTCLPHAGGGWETIAHRHGDPQFSDQDWFVRWGCIDFDEGEEESWVHARNVNLCLREFGITSWIERSRSKGYHVWVFLQEWLPARLVREALLAACQVVDAPTKEINPKSIELAADQLGNYVRAPYPGALMEDSPFPTDRRTMVAPADGSSIPLERFVEQALASRCSGALLEPLASLYEPPKRLVRVLPAMPVGHPTDMHKRMSGLAYTIWRDGPKEDMGRGHTLFKFACVLAEEGNHTEDEMIELCLEADERWGKFHERFNGEAQVYGVVERALGRR